MPAPLKLFYSYCGEDRKLRVALSARLNAQCGTGLIEEWDDRQILPGERFRPIIERRLGSTDIVLLLVTPNFFASEFCRFEMARALWLEEHGRTCVIPIVLCELSEWEKDEPCFGGLSSLPHPEAANWPQKRQLDDIAEGVRGRAQTFPPGRQPSERPIEVCAYKAVRVRNDPDKLLFWFTWDVEDKNVEPGPPDSAADWKELHTETDKLVVVWRELVHQLLEVKIRRARERTRVQIEAQHSIETGLRTATENFCKKLKALPFRNARFARNLVSLNKCIDPLKRSIADEGDSAYSDVVTLADRVEVWLLRTLQLADRMLDSHIPRRRSGTWSET